ncbi:MAG: AAA family ATPase [Clostridiales bacterium]|nr:AAA family ATPase [Clostridiales bacterium]
MKVEKLHFENKNFVVLIGDNGSGKTAILESITKAFVPVIRAINGDAVKMRDLNNEDIQCGSSNTVITISQINFPVAKCHDILYTVIRYKTFRAFAHQFPVTKMIDETEGTLMTYERFLAKLEESICTRIREEETVRRIQILKNNGVKLDGFSYCLKGHREQPTIYVNHYYRADMEMAELEKLAERILKKQRESILMPERDLMEVLDYSRMKDRIYYRLISRERNEELLQKVPWLPWQDLAIVFYIRIPDHIVERATAMIHESHMRYWGISIQELYRAAAVNMAKISVMLEPMEVFLEGCGIDVPESGMYILSNEWKEYGAAMIVDPGVQKMCLQRLGEDYYVLPSSIHEVILLPGRLASDRRFLDELVQEVNAKCVSREEFLSSHAYVYSALSGDLKF